MKINNKIKKGFTLVELVVVIAVIAILSAVSVGAYFGITESAKDSRLNQEITEIRTNITLISEVDPDDGIILNKDGLYIENSEELNNFKSQIDLNSGRVINVVTDESDIDTNNNDATILLFNITNTKPNYYDALKYYNHEINDKYAELDLKTFEISIKKDNSINTPIEEDLPVNDPNIPSEPVAARFEFGPNGGTSVTGNEVLDSYSEENEGYTLELESISNLFSRGTNNSQSSVLTVGKFTSVNNCEVGSFEFVVPNDIKAVCFDVAMYGGGLKKEASITVNGTTFNDIGCNQNTTNGNKFIIKVETKVNKRISISSSKVLPVVIDYIEFIK